MAKMTRKSKTSKTKKGSSAPKKKSSKAWDFGKVSKKKFKDSPAFDLYVYGKGY